MNEWTNVRAPKKKKKGWQQDQAFLKFSSESPGLWRNIEKMSSPYVLPFWAAWAGEYHINANFCYNHLFTLNYVLKELESPNAGYYIRGCQENVSLSPKWFIVSDEQPPPPSVPSWFNFTLVSRLTRKTLETSGNYSVWSLLVDGTRVAISW